MFVEHKEVGEIATAPAKTLKLSEAIRIGAQIRPQCSVEFYDDGKSCALGAALEAIGKRDEAMSYRANEVAWPYEWISKYFVLPEDFDELKDVGYLNDEGLSREQIADHLEAKGL